MIPDLAEYRYSNISFTILNLTETVITISVDGYEPLNSLNVLFQNSNGTIKGKGKISKIVTTGATTYQITDYTLNTTYANFQADVAINPNYYLKDSPANPYPLNNHIPSIRHLHDLLKTVNPSDFEVDQALVSNKGIVNTIDKNANFGLLSHKDKKIINDAGFFTKPFSFEITSTYKSIAYLLYDDKITRLIIKGGGETIPTFLYDLLIYANVDLNGTSFVGIINNSSILPGGYGLQFRVVKVVYNGKNYLRVDVLDSIYSSNTVNVQLHVSSFDKYRFVCENATSPIIINIGNLQTWTITNSTYSLDSKGNVKTFYIPEDESEILIAPSTDLAALLEPAYYYMLTGVETLTNKPAGLTTSFVMRIFRSGADLHVTNYLIIDSNSTIFTGTYDIVNSIIVWGASVIGHNTGDQEASDFDISDLADEEELREFWSNKEPALPATPTNPQTKFLNALKEWSQVPISGGGAFASNLYFTSLDSDISGYKKIDYYFEETEIELSAILSNEELLVRTYIYDLPLDTEIINQGTWSAAFMVKVDKGGENRLKFEAFVRHADNTERVLFSEYSPLITQQDYNEIIRWEKHVQGFIVLPTDRLGVRIYMSVTLNNVTINTLIGNGRGAYFTTPLQFRHDGLRGLNDNPNFQHVTTAQISGWDVKLDRPISVTYSELAALKTASELIPGQSYLINDYRTKYTQPTTLIINEGDPEPIIVKALSNSLLSGLAYSTIYPKDILYYSFDNSERFAPAADRGYIQRRTDTSKEIDLPYDFRNVKFRRWGVTAADWDVATTYAKYSFVKKNSKLYISVCDNNLGNDPELTGTENITLDTYEWIYLPFPIGSKVAVNADGKVGNWNMTPDGTYEDYLMFSTSEIYSYASNFKMTIRGWHIDAPPTVAPHDIWTPVNSVFFNYNPSTYMGVQNCVIQGDFFNNTILDNFSMINTYQIVYNNLFCKTLDNSDFKTHLRYNIFTDIVYHLKSNAWDIYGCLFGGSISQTNVRGNWNNNVFADEIYYSDFKGNQSGVTFKQSCVNSNFLCPMTNNTFYKLVQYLTATSTNFIEITFKGMVRYVTIEQVAQESTFEGDVQYCKLKMISSSTTNGKLNMVNADSFDRLTVNGDLSSINIGSSVKLLTLPAMTNVTIGRRCQSKDLSALTLTDKIYKIEMLASTNLKISYVDDFGIENFEIIV